MWDYTPKVMDHFLNPRNVGELENADAVGEVGNITCGDAMRLYLKIDKQTETITDVKVQTFGCASAIASASALTELIKGKTVAEAEKVSNQAIADFLGDLPEEKMHCSVMGQEALEAAFANYRGETYEHQEHDETPIVCTCFGITRGKIEHVVRENNLSTLEQVTNYTKAGGGCEGCLEDIKQIIDEVRRDMSREEAVAKLEEAREGQRPMTNLQRMKLITEAIERDVRPALQADGGDIELIDIDAGRVFVSLRGACAGCKAAGFTLTALVQAKIQDHLGEEVEVVEVGL